MSARLDHCEYQEALKKEHMKRLGRWEPTMLDFERMARFVTHAEAWADWEDNWDFAVRYRAFLSEGHRSAFMRKMYGIKD